MRCIPSSDAHEVQTTRLAIKSFSREMGMVEEMFRGRLTHQWHNRRCWQISFSSYICRLRQFHSLRKLCNVCRRPENVTASSGTAISTDFATLTCSEILSKILIRCVTWHWACDCSFRCFHEIGRYFDNKEQERAKTRARRHDRSQRRQEYPKIDSFWGANTGFIDFQHYATLCSGNRKNESFRLIVLVWCLEPLRPSFLAVWFAIFVPVFMYFQWFWLYSVALALV